MKKTKRSNVKRYNGKLNVIADNLRQIRESKNMSLAVLSDKLQLLGVDIPKPSLQNICNLQSIRSANRRNVERFYKRNKLKNLLVCIYE